MIQIIRMIFHANDVFEKPKAKLFANDFKTVRKTFHLHSMCLRSTFEIKKKNKMNLDSN